MTDDDDTQPEGIEPDHTRSQPRERSCPGGLSARGSPAAGALGLAHKRHPALATAGDIALGVRRLVFRDKLALFLALASAALAVTFFTMLGSIGPSSHGAQLPISRVVSLANHKQVATAVMLDHDNRVEITLKGPSGETRAVRHPAGHPPRRAPLLRALPLRGPLLQGPPLRGPPRLGSTRLPESRPWPQRRSSNTGPPTRLRARRRRGCCRASPARA